MIESNLKNDLELAETFQSINEVEDKDEFF